MKYIVQNSNLSILFISTFLFFSNEALFLPTLPLYLFEAGYTNFKIGVTLGSFALGVLLARPLTGFITDRKGRKISLITGVTIFLAAPLFYLLSTHFFYLIIVRFFHGLGIAFYTTAFPAYITDTVDDEIRGEIMGHMATSINLAFIFGPLIGIAVYKTFGFTHLIITCIFIACVNLIVIIFITDTNIKTGIGFKIPYQKVVFKRSILIASFIQFFNALIFGGIMTFLPLHLKNIEGVTIGVFFMVESFIVIIFRFIAGHFADRYGKGPVFFYSFLMIIVSVFFISNITTLTMLVFAAVLFGIGTSLCSPALTAFVADKSDAAARGTVFSFFYAAFDAGVVSAGIILGSIADLTSIKDMFVFTAIGGLLSLLLFSILIKKGFRQSLKWTLLLKKPMV